MTQRIYNTSRRRKEDFEPLEPGRVRMYVCGPTVYDLCHVGHARSVVVFDVMARFLRRSYDVTYVRNFTDVDDKIIRRARERGEAPDRLAQHFIDEFYRDMDALNVERPDHEPRVTEYIPEIVACIRRLVEQGNAYAVDGDVFFDVASFAGYGRLSGRDLSEMEAGARVEVDPRKRSPFDFALWKSAKTGEPSWDSPWGTGRPGWHIECSAMSSRLLGETFDIHGGGKDLIFPHHENEIAQSEALSGRPYVNYWVHNGFVNIDHEKMSKSLGNFLTVRDLLAGYHPEAIRLFLLSSHYRSPIDFTRRGLAEATAGLERIYTLLERVGPPPGRLPEEPAATGNPHWQRFQAAMEDDFNTARGIAALFEAVRDTNGLLDAADVDAPAVESNRDAIAQMGRFLGILTLEPAAFFDQRREQGVGRQGVDAGRVDRLVAERRAARAARDWARADAIRDELAAMNVVLEDRPDGTVWKLTR